MTGTIVGAGGAIVLVIGIAAFFYILLQFIAQGILLLLDIRDTIYRADFDG